MLQSVIQLAKTDKIDNIAFIFFDLFFILKKNLLLDPKKKIAKDFLLS